MQLLRTARTFLGESVLALIRKRAGHTLSQDGNFDEINLEIKSKFNF